MSVHSVLLQQERLHRVGREVQDSILDMLINRWGPLERLLSPLSLTGSFCVSMMTSGTMTWNSKVFRSFHIDQCDVFVRTADSYHP